MRALISVWLCVLLGLLPLEIQSRALTLQTHRHRLDLSKHPTPTHLPPVMDNHLSHAEGQLMWRALILKELPQHHDNPAWQRGSRGRRHANSLGGRGHLMRVGCVLGTCQVQNLSHRLYQLIGQSGREDSSPINPRSPHSYG